MAKKKEEATDQVQTELTIGEGGQGSNSDAGAQPAQNPVGMSDGVPTPEPQETIRVEFLTNCTHNRDRYNAGQRESLPEDVFEILLKAKAVRRLGE